MSENSNEIDSQAINRSVSDAVPLVEVRRGAIVESRHRGHIAVIDGRGETVAALGAIETVTYLRSSAKPFQALPLITSGAADAFNFTEREIAVACGSHSGETIHTQTVQAMLDRANLSSSLLKCGIHEPFDREIARGLRRDGVSPDVLQNNCSGKHTAMLTLALRFNAPTNSYDDPEHPVQVAIKKYVALFANMEASRIVVGVDGCGVPVFGMPVRSMAAMYAHLISPPADFDDATRIAAPRIIGAMRKFPEMVGGTRERLDTEIIRATEGRVISKVGAEGVYTAGVMPSDDFPHGLGIALKIEDGEDRRGRPVVVIEVLRQLGLLSEKAQAALMPYSRFDVRNHRREVVGEIVPRFRLV